MGRQMMRVSPSLPLVLALAAATSWGCGTLGRTRVPDAVLPGDLVRVELLGGTDEDLRVVTWAASQSLDHAQRWSPLKHPVTIRIHPDHAALERASRQSNVPWMRGWARFSEVELEAPSRWGGDRAPGNVVELLRHELTHVAMYQDVAEARTWARMVIPLWFREGMASVASLQGYRRMAVPDLAAWLRANPNLDPWGSPESLGPALQPVVYGAAHRGFERLLDRVGDDGIRRILRGLREGLGFDASFAAVVGTRPMVFLATFRDELTRTTAALPSPLLVSAGTGP
jgi:hypothetical protein